LPSPAGAAADLLRFALRALQVVGRGEHLELLVDKSDGISSQARQFQKQSIGLRKVQPSTTKQAQWPHLESLVSTANGTSQCAAQVISK
jgi:hypothetical protein